ncbi:MAG: hypothetical protein V4750_17875 [Pseudomonadota bacterium]
MRMSLNPSATYPRLGRPSRLPTIELERASYLARLLWLFRR